MSAYMYVEIHIHKYIFDKYMQIPFVPLQNYMVMKIAFNTKNVGLYPWLRVYALKSDLRLRLRFWSVECNRLPNQLEDLHELGLSEVWSYRLLAFAVSPPPHHQPPPSFPFSINELSPPKPFARPFASNAMCTAVPRQFLVHLELLRRSSGLAQCP
jgi:hypothetical protein